MVAKSELPRVAARLKIFVNGDGDFQIELVKVSKLLISQYALASGVGGAIPGFLGYVTGKHLVDFEDRFDTIQVAFFGERFCVKANPLFFLPRKTKIFNPHSFQPCCHPVREKLEQQEQDLNRYRVVGEFSVTQPDPINGITQEQLDAFLASAIAEHEQIKGEEHAAHYTEIEANAIALAETNKNLQEQLQQKERELDEIQSLQLQAYEAENQQLRQRVQDLEKAFSESGINRLDYIEDQNASTTPELEKKYKSLLEKVEQEERELDGYGASSNIELETAINKEDAEALATELSTALELFGIPGWGRQGYCATNNRIYKGWDAVKAFLQEAFSINQTSEKWGVA